MPTLAVCKKCKSLYDYKPVVKYEGGTSYTEVVCPNCGNVIRTNSNHVHYGNDGLG